jgi:hypothetical protein
MNDERPDQRLTNVFVLMLENHSFDNIFAMSDIPRINVATVKDFNFAYGKKYFVQYGAPWCATTDPGHEFEDVLEQLCGCDAVHSLKYPLIYVIPKVPANVTFWRRISWYRSTSGRRRASGILGMRS